jgi:hypothetical protein
MRLNPRGNKNRAHPTWLKRYGELPDALINKTFVNHDCSLDAQR